MDSSHSNNSCGEVYWYLYFVLFMIGSTIYDWLSGEYGGFLESFAAGVGVMIAVNGFFVLPLLLLAWLLVSIVNGL